ncbi:MAG: hypothetical protein KC546_21270, partial [Anaerolineae bacterium]|nr:hypothetical protein [Anaerolineae bacterium]
IRVIWWRFLGIWVVGAIVGWFYSMSLTWTDLVPFVGDATSVFAMSVVPGPFIALAQAFALPIQISQSRVGWFFVTLAGYVANIFGLFMAIAMTPHQLGDSHPRNLTLLFVTIFTLPVLVQWLFVLRKSLDHNWVYPLAAFVTALTLPIAARWIINTFEATFLTYPFVAVCHAFTMGLVVLALIYQTQHKHLQSANSTPSNSQP